VSDTNKLERAAAKAAVSRDALHTMIREAHAAGMSLRTIAKAVGMSHEQVRRLTSR